MGEIVGFYFRAADLQLKFASFIRSQIVYDSIQGNRVMMGASTKILLVSIPANPKLSANSLADCAAAVHPHRRRQQRRSIVPRFLGAFLRIDLNRPWVTIVKLSWQSFPSSWQKLKITSIFCENGYNRKGLCQIRFSPFGATTLCCCVGSSKLTSEMAKISRATMMSDNIVTRTLPAFSKVRHLKHKS